MIDLVRRLSLAGDASVHTTYALYLSLFCAYMSQWESSLEVESVEKQFHWAESAQAAVVESLLVEEDMQQGSLTAGVGGIPLWMSGLVFS